MLNSSKRINIDKVLGTRNQFPELVLGSARHLYHLIGASEVIEKSYADLGRMAAKQSMLYKAFSKYLIYALY